MTREPFRRAIAPGLIPGRRSAAEMDEEIAAHLEMRVQDLVARGMTPEDARAEAERRFGDLDESRRRLRAGARRRDRVRRKRDRLGAIAGDVRFAWRQARRFPVFSAIAVATLAVGIGLTTATFALVDHVLLRPLPFAEPERLVSLSSVDSAGNDFTNVSSSNWQDWRREARTLEATAIYLDRTVAVRGVDGAVRVPGQIASGAFFEVVRPRFIVGRPFTDQEVADGSDHVVVSERFWRSMLGADSALASPLRTVTGDHRVVGVVAAGHELPAGTDVWHPTIPAPARTGTRNNVNWKAVARLRPDASIAQATSDLAVVAAGIRASDPTALYSYGVKVRALDEQITGGAAGYLQLLLGAVAFVLLIACANVAAGNLARGTLRARELAVRAAIGAGRTRLVQQLLVEHALLAVIAGALGVALAWAGLRAAIAAWGEQVPRAMDVQLDARVLAAAAAVTLIASLLSGIVPAIAASRPSLTGLIAAGSRGATRGARATAGSALVAGQIAIALLLVCGSALMIRSFQALVSRDLGFTVNAATVEAALVAPGLRDDTARQYAYWEELRRSLGAIPGVARVGFANWTPLGSGGASFIDIEGRDLSNVGAGFRVVSDEYLEALSVPLLSGRQIAESDVSGSVPVTVINQAMADRYWPGENPLGRRVRAVSMEGFAVPAPWRTVVGVVGNVRNGGFDSDVREEMYVPHRQAPYWVIGMTAIVRSELPIDRLVPEIRARARRVDPAVAVEVGTMARRAEQSVASRRMTMSLLGIFGAVSLLLAALGTYGLLSYTVAGRERELAVRSALGATRARLVAMVVAGASSLITVGVLAGIAGALALTRFLESQLVDIERTDPVSLLGGVAIIVAAALMAALIPAVRASTADPAVALRAE